MGEVLKETLPQQLPVEMSVAWNGDFLDSVERPDVILMYHCHTSADAILTENQKDKLLTLVKEGVGVVALHASYYSFVEWDEYHEFYGARFIRHGDAEALLHVTSQNTHHPVMKGIDKPLDLVSELYQSTPVAEDCQVLAHAEDKKEGIPRPSIWTRRYGKGRIVTILPGHWVENFRDAAFQRLIVNSMTWVVDDNAAETATVIKDHYDWEEAALNSFKLPEGFEISLVAAEPYLANPISMTLDEAGNIYVSNAHSFREKWWLMDPPPEFEPTNPVMRIVVGPDGRAVEAAVVADGFENPVMGLAVRGNQLWATNLKRLFVTELNKAGRMTGEVKTLVRDAATPWNPFGMYRVAFGPDDLLYLSVGDHDIELSGTTGKSAVRLEDGGSGGVFRLRKDGSDLELLLQGVRAPFTFGFTPFGQHWVITNGEGSPNILLNAIYGTDYRFRNRTKGNWSWLSGADPLAAPVWQTPAGSSTEVLPYYSSAFPDKYWGNLFVPNFGTHGEPAKHNEVLRLMLDDRDQIIHSEIFLSSSDPKFRPTQVYLTPDGSLYLLDWYGKDDDNDLTGRLYLIRYTGKDTLTNSDNGLGNRNHSERRKAREILLAAGPDSSLPVLDKVLSGKFSLAAVEALWTLRSSDWESAADHIRKAFSFADWRVRRLAVQLLRDMGKQKEENLEKLMSDADPAVQLEAALGFRAAPARCSALVQALIGGAAKDPNLRFTAALEIARFGQYEHFSALLADENPDVRLAGLVALDEAFYESSKGFKTSAGIPALTAWKVLAYFIAQPGKLDSKDLLDLAKSWPDASLKNAVNDFVMAQLGRMDVSAGDFAQGLETLKRMGLPTSGVKIDPARIRLLDGSAKRSLGDTGEKLAYLKVLEEGNPRIEDIALLKLFLGDESAAVRAKAFILLGSRHAGNATAVALCRDLALNGKAGLAQRLDALVALANLEKKIDAESWTKLLLSSRHEIALASLRSLQSCTDRDSALRMVADIAESLRKQHGSAIHDDLKFTMATLAGNLVGNRDKDSLRRKVLADGSAGNAELGRLVFQMRGCYTCHVANPAGLPVPLLDNTTASLDVSYLVDSILYPVKSVKPGFLTQMITIAGRAGKEEVLIGTLRRDVGGDGKLDEVIDGMGQSRLYPSRDFIRVETISAMPSGLEATMSQTELVDLIAYLQTLL